MKNMLSRRRLIRNMFGAAAAGAMGSPLCRALLPQAGYSGSTGYQRGEMGRIAGAFRRSFSVPASSIAITHNGRFAYDEAIGMAYIQKQQQVQQSSLFRIANLSAPITSVAIFTLIEKGKLNLNDKVFGPSGVLGDKYGKAPYRQYVTDITVDNLLTHTAGGWPDNSTDPMLRSDSWDQTKLITWTIANMPLTSPPGQNWAYSNFGYCVLGRVIEQVSGQPYADFVQANVLGPCGITDMKIAENKMSQRAPNEVAYYGQYSENPYKINIARMDSCCGWLATSQDLVIFLDHVGGAPNIQSLLKPETIRTMTTPCAVYPQSSEGRYARGWMVSNNGAGNSWHSGSLPGSTTTMTRTATGLCWAALTNTRTEPSDTIDAALNEAMWNMVRCVPGWGV